MFCTRESGDVQFDHSFVSLIRCAYLAFANRLPTVPCPPRSRGLYYFSIGIKIGSGEYVGMNGQCDPVIDVHYHVITIFVFRVDVRLMDSSTNGAILDLMCSLFLFARFDFDVFQNCEY